jgi:hypothetical protein
MESLLSSLTCSKARQDWKATALAGGMASLIPPLPAEIFRAETRTNQIRIGIMLLRQSDAY